jgi:hypothetical protein
MLPGIIVFSWEPVRRFAQRRNDLDAFARFAGAIEIKHLSVCKSFVAYVDVAIVCCCAQKVDVLRSLARQERATESAAVSAQSVDEATSEVPF